MLSRFTISQTAIEIGDHNLLKLCFEHVAASALRPTSTPVYTSDLASTFKPDIVERTFVELLAAAKSNLNVIRSEKRNHFACF